MKAYLKGHIMFPLIAISVLLLVGLMFDSSDDDTQDDPINLLDEANARDFLTELDSGVDLLNESDSGAQYETTDDATVLIGEDTFEATDEDDEVVLRDIVPNYTFTRDGDDTIFGGAQEDSVFSGRDDDVIFGAGGDDRLHGDSGNDTIFGGAGNDTLIGNTGYDELFGGAGDDVLYPGRWSNDQSDIFGLEVVSAGAGDDLVHLTQGGALIELGEGEDDVIVFSTWEDNDPVAIITDFDPNEDQIVLGVYVPDYDFPGEATRMDATYSASLIETSQGFATLIMPAVTDEALLSGLNPQSVGHAILLGVDPSEIQDNNIRVIVSNSNILDGSADR